MVNLSISKNRSGKYKLALQVDGKSAGSKEYVVDNGMEVFEQIEYFLKSSEQARSYIRG